MGKFQDKYRIESTRLDSWDYGSVGWYFVTICIKDRSHAFGEIQDGVMHLSPLGVTAQQYLVEIPDHFSHTDLDAYVVMPNHIHAIIVIRNLSVETSPDEKSSPSPVETPPDVITSPPNVATQHVASLPQPKRKFGPMKSGSLSKIVQGYKAAVTRQARAVGHAEFTWQERFYDHIIRDEKSLDRIRAYIEGNPAKWQDDEYNLE